MGPLMLESGVVPKDRYAGGDAAAFGHKATDGSESSEQDSPPLRCFTNEMFVTSFLVETTCVPDVVPAR